MPPIVRRVWYFAALLLGFGPAALLFTLVFSEAGAAGLLVRVALALVPYLVLGGAFGYFRPGRPVDWALRIGVGAMVLLGFVGLMALRAGALQGAALALGVLLAVIAAGAAGAWAGTRAAHRSERPGDVASTA